MCLVIYNIKYEISSITFQVSTQFNNSNFEVKRYETLLPYLRVIHFFILFSIYVHIIRRHGITKPCTINAKK